MLSIVTESISNKNQIMSILSDNYHTIIISIISILLTTLIIYTFKYYYPYHTNNKNNNNNTNTNNNSIMDPPSITPKPKSNPPQQQQHNKNKNKTKFVPTNVPSVTAASTSPQKQITSKTNTTPQITSKNTPTGIPTQINFFSKEKNNNFSTYKSHKPKPSTTQFNKNHSFIPENINFTPNINVQNINVQNNNNNTETTEGQSDLATIAKITKTTTIQFDGSKEQPTITIKQETTIQAAPEVKWSPFIDGLRFAVQHNQGKRDHMENSASIIDMSNSQTNGNMTYSFSLFDGHLGDEAAKFCTENLHQHVSENIKDSNDTIENNIRKAFHQTDDEFKQYAVNKQCEAGAVGVYVLYNSNCIYVANVGDCKAILCSNGKLKPLTIDHNPMNEDEKKRCGAYIDTNSHLLSGQISVTRAIGDYYVTNNMEKLDGLICDPYICKHILTEGDEFLIIACDGLWDVLDDKFVMTAARQSLRNNGDVNICCQKLIKLAAKKSDSDNPLTSDNISVMVVGFANKDKATGKLHIGPKREAIPRPPGGGLRRRFARKRANSAQQ